MSDDTSNPVLDNKIVQWKELVKIRDQMVEMGLDTAGIMSELEGIFKVRGLKVFYTGDC